jgi:S-formylglutathione hydrolase FrmB
MLLVNWCQGHGAGGRPRPVSERDEVVGWSGREWPTTRRVCEGWAANGPAGRARVSNCWAGPVGPKWTAFYPLAHSQGVRRKRALH